LPLYLHPARLEEVELPAAVTAMAERIGRDAFLRQQKAIMGRPDSRRDLVRIDCPTLVLCGRQDQPTPLARHTEMAAGIARSRLVVIEDCGHLAPIERPAEVTAALKAWLSAE
jgi:pimeloyl-ACP methyl ester carboxylesterase